MYCLCSAGRRRLQRHRRGAAADVRVGPWPGTNDWDWFLAGPSTRCWFLARNQLFCWFLARNKQLLLGPGQEPTIVAGSRPGTNNCCWALARDQQTLLGPGQEPTIVAGTPAGRRYPPKDFLFQGALALWPLTLLLELPGQFCSDSCPSPAIW